MGGTTGSPRLSAARRAWPLIATASAVLLVGCGGTVRSGHSLFVQDCGGCHTISGTNAPHHQGGDLLGVHLPRRVLLQFMREMPVHPAPDSAQLQSVADYVLTVQRSAR